MSGTATLVPSRIADASALHTRLVESGALTVCSCGETVTPSGRCLNIGDCRHADRSATRGSLRRGAAASARPAAWNVRGGVD